MPKMVDYAPNVEDVKEGDYLPGHEATVARKEIKQKYVYLYTGEPSDHALRIPKGQVLYVKRSEPTAEEKRDKLRKNLDDHVEEFIKSMRQLAKANVLAEIVEQLKKDDNVRYTLHWQTQYFLKRDARVRVAAEFVGWVDSEHGQQDGPLEVVKEFIKELKSRLLHAATYANNHSTNPVDTLEKETQMEVWAELLSSYGHRLVPIIWALDELEKLEAEADA